MKEKIEITGINHITFAVADLEKSVTFYNILFEDCLIAKGEGLAYYDVAGVWFVLNLENKIPSKARDRTYSHIAFSMDVNNQKKLKTKLDQHGIVYESGRKRDVREGQAIYIRDYDGHLIEFYNLNLKDRLNFYKENREDIKLIKRGQCGNL